MAKENFLDRLVKAYAKKAQTRIENDPYYQDIMEQYHQYYKD